MLVRILVTALLVILLAPGPGLAQDLYDVVILNGRVMDPETGRDEVANIGIRGERIEAITTQEIRGRKTIDASGQIVAPGFIDILASIGRNRAAHTFKIGDGVTTVLGMHGGPLDVERYVEEHTAVGPLANYAATVSHSGLREAVGATDRYAPATPEQIEAMRLLAVRAIRDGAVGIGFGVNYTPGASYEEIFALFEVAAAEGVPCHLHARYKGNVFPLTMSLAAMEVVAIAAATGAQAQLAHLISSTRAGGSGSGVRPTRTSTWLKLRSA